MVITDIQISFETPYVTSVNLLIRPSSTPFRPLKPAEDMPTKILTLRAICEDVFRGPI